MSDALDSLKISGVALGLQALTVRKRVVGAAMTVQLGPDDGRAVTRHLCTAAVEASGPGQVIVIAHDARVDAAGWGGMLSLGASKRGIEGVIVDGACRDVDQAREFGLPIYGRSAVPITARGRVVEYAWNVPVTLCGTIVKPGDLVVADGSGVVFIPDERVHEVLALVETLREREARMMEELRRGQPLSRVLGKNYEAMISGNVRA